MSPVIRILRPFSFCRAIYDNAISTYHSSLTVGQHHDSRQIPYESVRRRIICAGSDEKRLELTAIF